MAQSRVDHTIKERTVRRTPKRTLSNVLFALLTALLFLVPGGRLHAQSTTRNFQISLWECCTTPPPPVTHADSDIREFGYSVTQPPPPALMQPTGGPTILVINGAAVTPPNSISLHQITNVSNWSQIAAVEIDEPYGTYVDGYLGGDGCNPPTPQILQIDNALSLLASELKGPNFNPKARFWVNFTSKEANWMVTCTAPGTFNRPYIDVISEDAYSAYIWDLTPFYNMVAASPASPSQQLALVPGVFSAPANQQSYLQGYFDQASMSNQTCNLPLGSRGITGIYDGCPFWVVMGWLSEDYTDTRTQPPTVYKGMLDGSSGSQAIRAIWEAEVALVPVTPTQQTRAKAVLPAIQLLLE